MQKLTEAELTVILNRGLAVVDQPLPEIVFDLDPLDFDVDIDLELEAEAETYAKPSAVAHVHRTPAPASSKTSLSGSTPITIRIPGVVLAAVKAKAQEMGHLPVMLVEALVDMSHSWGLPATTTSINLVR